MDPTFREFSVGAAGEAACCYLRRIPSTLSTRRSQQGLSRHPLAQRNATLGCVFLHAGHVQGPGVGGPSNGRLKLLRGSLGNGHARTTRFLIGMRRVNFTSGVCSLRAT